MHAGISLSNTKIYQEMLYFNPIKRFSDIKMVDTFHTIGPGRFNAILYNT